MKPIISYALLSAFLAVGAQAATTDPVGYITAEIAPNTSGVSAGAGTFVTPSLVNPVDFSGQTTNDPSGGTVLNFSGGVPAGLGMGSMVEITSGDNAGFWTSVTSSTETSITVSDVIPVGSGPTAQIAVRRFTTISDLFGDNEVGLEPAGGANPFDEIQLLDPTDQSTKTIVFFGDAWFDFVSEAPAGDEIIYPGTSVLVIRRGATPLSLVNAGSVKLTPTQVDVFPGTNWIGQPNATGETFGSLLLAPQILPAGGANPNDFVDILRADQSADTYIAFDPGDGPAMFNFVSEAPASDEPLAEGSGFVLRRDPASPSSVITFPAEVVAE